MVPPDGVAIFLVQGNHTHEHFSVLSSHSRTNEYVTIEKYSVSVEGVDISIVRN
jgi:hypothetical protein